MSVPNNQIVYFICGLLESAINSNLTKGPKECVIHKSCFHITVHIFHGTGMSEGQNYVIHGLDYQVNMLDQYLQ